MDVAVARRHLERLASAPRPAGGEGERAARAYCAAELRALGFAVREEPFTYSAAPGRYATPAAGVASILLIATAAHAGWRGHAGWALHVLVAGLVVLGLAGAWVARHGVLRLPWLRRVGTNLTATRGDAPALWLVAHLDSKSQPVPIGLRALGVMLSVIVWIAALAMAGLQSHHAAAAGAWPWIAVAALVAGAPVAASVVGARSPGALDDASGVASVLSAAAGVPRERSLGVLLTSAEELGLAGARAWARAHAPGTAINIDGVDDVGAIRVSWSRPRPTALAAGVVEAARVEGERAAAAPLIPGILVDGVALADAGWVVVTISRGTWRTVARIHTRRDGLEHLRGGGVAAVARVVARFCAEAR